MVEARGLNWSRGPVLSCGTCSEHSVSAARLHARGWRDVPEEVCKPGCGPACCRLCLYLLLGNRAPDDS